MAWRCSGKTNAELISNMQQAGLINSPRVATAMSKVDRANYVLGTDTASAYVDAPQPIGFGATISAPHMHAHACEALLPYLKPGNSVLDVGSGSGYTMGIFWHLVSEDGKPGRVVGIDHIQGLVDAANKNLEKDGLSHERHKSMIEAITGDGRKGHAPRAPYNAIHVGAAAPRMAQELIDQLAKPGRMFIPVEDSYGDQDVWQVDKDESGKVTQEKLFGVRYVPLTNPEAQWPGGSSRS